MSPSQTHPRRRAFKASSPQISPLSTHGMQLRKSGTFSSPTNVSSDLCGLDNRHYMPKRSPTSTDNLEELVNDAGVQRVANLLKDFDKKLASHGSSNPSAGILNDPEVLPLPSFILDRASLENDPMEIDSKPSLLELTPHDHASDSGLGSSVSGSKYGERPLRSSTRGSISTSVTSTHSAITRSASSLGALEEKHTLGDYACKQIHDHIIKPILAEESLKDFHPLIRDVPRRIGEKNISNLRDLEKTLIFLAPIRRYAAIMSATRQKEENGEELDEMDYSPSEKITLRGGLSHNGRPAEFVREKNGKVIPINENSPDEQAYSGFTSGKRALSDDEFDEEGVKRSMARRRKSDKPGDVMHVCRDCKKEFKRPCDLTKHEKTHSRPWKCTEEKCKYYELGWPTEKERDRHVNDKHSAAPPQYKCLYPPCTYASKRESNCKQHMEKAHGWEYVRSKSNGKKKAPTSSDRSPPTPLTPFLGTPRSSLATPISPFTASPSVPLINDFDYGYSFDSAVNFNAIQTDFRRDSSTTDGSVFTYSSGQSPTEPNAFNEAVTPEDPTINHNDIFNCALNSNIQTSAFQQPTPALSTGFDNFDTFDFVVNTTTPATNNTIPHLSPGAQPDVTLFSPQIQMDEGFEDGPSFTRPTGDFTLFDANPGTNIGGTTGGEFFPDLSPADLNQFGGQFDQIYQQPPMSSNFDDMLGF